jgi:hypothetical protein
MNASAPPPRNGGFRVVPDALASAEDAYGTVSDGWDQLGGNLESWRLGDNDLGLLGRVSGVVGAYNAAVTMIHDKLRLGGLSFDSAQSSVGKVAKEYLAQDEKYYAKFGWTKGLLDKIAQPPGGRS